MADLEAWGAAGSKYNIHEETLSAFRRMQDMGLGLVFNETMTPEDLRARALRRSEVLGGHVDFVGSETELIVPSAGNDDGVPVSVYRPAHVSPDPVILIYFHGGGLVTSSRNVYVTMVKTLAKRAQCIAVNVEYRLAPEHKAPAAFDDCRSVTRWVLANKKLVGGEEGSPVGIGGDSAGGHLAASISHDVPELAFQILVYPYTDLTFSAPSLSEFVDTPGLNLNSMHWFMSQYLSSESQKTDPVVSPYHRTTFSPLLPPALCILAELDPLRDDGLAYCKKLEGAGVPTQVLLVKGAAHGFFNLPAHYKELTKEPYAKCVEFLTQFQKA
ncbi:ethyl acetate hydrolase-like [Babylonia areolata]|uniref:ethyl acetate hydrolase-like n=1 Tax=Babylonia areolata TaxID=304850 RepID=UPI003FD6391E